MSGGIVGQARRLLAVVGVAAVIVAALSNLAFAKSRVRIAENTSPLPPDRVFFNYNYFATVAEAGLSGGSTTGHFANNVDRHAIGFEKAFFGTDSWVRIPFLSPPIGGNTQIIVGVKLRAYFGSTSHSSQNQFNNAIVYSRDWMIMPYLGVPIIFGPTSLPFGAQALFVTPYVGPIFENGELSILLNNQNNQSGQGITRTGVGLGVNFDLLLPPMANGWVPIIGASGQVSFLPSVQERIGNDIVHMNGDTELRVAVRGGVLVPSDRRLKRDVALLRRLDNGIALYRYRYLWSEVAYVGVMAQEVAAVAPDAVVRGADGYLRVDYGRLGLRLMTFKAWSARQAPHRPAMIQ